MGPGICIAIRKSKTVKRHFPRSPDFFKMFAMIKENDKMFDCGSFLLFVIVFVKLSCLFLTALWSPASKGLTSWLYLILCFPVFFITFTYNALGK